MLEDFEGKTIIKVIKKKQDLILYFDDGTSKWIEYTNIYNLKPREIMEEVLEKFTDFDFDSLVDNFGSGDDIVISFCSVLNYEKVDRILINIIKDSTAYSLDERTDEDEDIHEYDLEFSEYETLFKFLKEFKKHKIVGEAKYLDQLITDVCSFYKAWDKFYRSES